MAQETTEKATEKVARAVVVGLRDALCELANDILRDNQLNDDGSITIDPEYAKRLMYVIAQPYDFPASFEEDYFKNARLAFQNSFTREIGLRGY